ncbi:hypothetical protein B0H17DRAFT_1032896, partial [Mycena rosella]
NTLTCIALVHSDTNADNILIHDGVLSGLIDWEVPFHRLRCIFPASYSPKQRSAALPTYLAARYPRFLRSDGIWDPSFESRDRKMDRFPVEWPTT